MNETYEKMLNAYKSIKDKIDFRPEIGIILGSGLGDFADSLDVKYEISYSDIEGFPVSTVPGHDGKFIFAILNKKPVVVMKGRIHFYEGYDIKDVVLPVRVMGLLGIRKLILTNAAGGVNYGFKPGNLMLITDHISAFVPSPLNGANINELGTRFPDMSKVYDEDLSNIIRKEAKKVGVDLKEGTYLQWQGPNFETPAEIKMFRTMGADAVGMSTAVEAIAAHHMGIRVCGISCITNLAAGMTNKKLNHEEVQEVASQVKTQFTNLLLKVIEEI